MNRHLKICPFDDKRISDNIKKQLTKSSSSAIVNFLHDEDTNTVDYLSFNPKNASLKKRLFQKNPELIGKVLNEEENGNGNSDIFSLIGVERKHIPNNLIEYKNTLTPEIKEKSLNENLDNQEGKNEEFDINFIFSVENVEEKEENTFVSNNLTTNETNNFLNNKRTRAKTSKNESPSENDISVSVAKINKSSTVNKNEEENYLDDEGKKELEYVLGLYLNDYKENRINTIIENSDKN